MKAKIVLACSFGILVCGQCLAQSDKYFTKTYGGSNTDVTWKVQQIATDNGYILAGTTDSPSSGTRPYIYVVRTDKKGDTVWVRTYSGDSSQFELGYDIKTTADSNYIVTGTTHDTITGLPNMYLIKINDNGNILWEQQYGDTLDNVCYEAQQTSDGGYVITGWSYDTNSVAQIHLIKTDDSGNLVWEKKYGAVNHYESFAVQQTTDKGYILAGKRLIGVFNFDGYVLKVDSLGNFQWDYTFGGIADDGASDVVQTLDGGYIIASRINFSSKIAPYLLKLDVNGSKQWDKTFYDNNSNGVSVFASVKQMADGSYIAAGSTSLPDNNYFDAIIIKTDAAGDSIWGRVYGGAMNDYFYDVQLTSDSGFIACGRTESFGAGGADAWLVKMNCLGFAGPPAADFTYTPSGDTAFFTNQSDSAGAYLWNFGDGDTSAAVNPVHAYSDTGTYTVTLIASACGESDTVTKTVNITSVGIAEDAKNKNGAYLGNNIPNPFSSTTIIKAEVPEYVNNAELTIYDLTGRAVKTYKLQKGYNDVVVNTYDLNNGMYIYTMRADGKLIGNKKMIILK